MQYNQGSTGGGYSQSGGGYGGSSYNNTSGSYGGNASSYPAAKPSPTYSGRGSGSFSAPAPPPPAYRCATASVTDCLNDQDNCDNNCRGLVSGACQGPHYQPTLAIVHWDLKELKMTGLSRWASHTSEAQWLTQASLLV